jgi:hypothetical protein
MIDLRFLVPKLESLKLRFFPNFFLECSNFYDADSSVVSLVLKTQASSHQNFHHEESDPSEMVRFETRPDFLFRAGEVVLQFFAVQTLQTICFSVKLVFARKKVCFLLRAPLIGSRIFHCSASRRSTYPWVSVVLPVGPLVLRIHEYHSFHDVVGFARVGVVGSWPCHRFLVRIQPDCGQEQSQKFCQNPRAWRGDRFVLDLVVE